MGDMGVDKLNLAVLAVFGLLVVFGGSPVHAQAWTFDTEAADWTAVSGTWAVENGEYSGTKGLADGPWNDGATYANAANFSDFAYEARFRVVDGIGVNKIWGLVFRANQSYRGYLFEFVSPSELNLYRLNPGWTASGGWNTLQSSTTPSINLGDWHTLRVVAEGASIKGYFDGNLQVSVNDSAYSSGNIGLRAINGAHVHFDNVTVATMAATPIPTLIPTMSPNATSTPTQTPSQTPNATAIPTATSTPVITPNVTATPASTPNVTITPTPAKSPIPTLTATPTQTPTAAPTVCAQVITYATNPEGKNCRQFPTPCDVPRNWIVVDSCPAANKTQCDNGCFRDGLCIQFGTRLIANGTPQYCDFAGKGLKLQKNDTEPCQNGYECVSDYCSNGVCGSMQKELSGIKDLLEKILDFLKKLFGKLPTAE